MLWILIAAHRLNFNSAQFPVKRSLIAHHSMGILPAAQASVQLGEARGGRGAHLQEDEDRQETGKVAVAYQWLAQLA